MKLKIKITKDILFRSRFCGAIFGEKVSENCAIALAVRDIFPGSAVAPGFIFLKNEMAYISLPTVANDFIEKFDFTFSSRRFRLPELEFEIEVSENIIDSIGINEVHKILSESKTLELIQ